MEYLKHCPDDVEKINMSFESVENKDAVMEQFTSRARIFPLPVDQHKKLELTREGTDKGTALLEFGRKMNIAKESILACGDSGNDRMMLKKVAIGVAMATQKMILSWKLTMFYHIQTTKMVWHG